MRAYLLLLLFLVFVASCQETKKEEPYDPDSFINPELFKDHIRTPDFQTTEQNRPASQRRPVSPKIFK